MLVGRAWEIEQIGAMLDAACCGRAAVLRISGDPGMGKTALLDVAERLAGDRRMQVVRFTAVETECGFPSSGLSLLLRLLGHPASTSSSPATLLEALGRASSAAPLLLLLDDMQWLDDWSVRAVVFACRRLLADPVAVVMTCMTGASSLGVLDGFSRIELPALSAADSLALLRYVVPRTPAGVAREIAVAMAGVPLALVGVRDLLPADALAGLAPLPVPIPAGEAVQVRYARGFQSLDPSARRALTVMATDDTADPTVLVAALGLCGLSVQSLLPAERLGLVRVDPVPRFIHPLARAAVQGSAAPSWQRDAHVALAAVLRERGDVRALRHRALGSAGPDESVARALESASRWLASDAPGRACQLALMAADVSPGQNDRIRRLVLAAELCDDTEQAAQLASSVLAGTTDPNDRARATMVLADSTPGAAPTTLVHLITSVDRDQVDPALAAELLSRLTWGAMEDADLPTLRELVRNGLASTTDGWVLCSARGSALMFLGHTEPAVAALRRAQLLSDAIDLAELPTEMLTTWGVIPGWLGEDDQRARARLVRMEQVLRSRARPIDVIYADYFSAERARREGAWERAIALLTHDIAISQALGYPQAVDHARLAGLHALRGEQEECSMHVAAARQAFAVRPSAWLELWVTQARGALALSMGQPEEASAILVGMRDVGFLGRGCRDSIVGGLVDLVESEVTLGDLATAGEVTADLVSMTHGLVDPLGVALVERCQALVQPRDADELLGDALQQMDRTTDAFERGRTEMHLGEHLRRTRRRRLSRGHLLAAHETFTRLGARPWAARAHGELLASGDAPRPSRPTAPSQALTPQELRVALEVARGLSNAEVGQSLFLSTKTVEFHLGKVYRKLGVRSRGGLAQAMGSRGLLDTGG